MKRMIMGMLVILGACFSSSLVWAEEESEKSDAQKNATTVVTYPVNFLRETGKVALKTGERVVNTAADTAQTTGQVLTGDIKKTPEIVITPVKGTAEGLAETATSTVSIPKEALKDSEEAAE